MSLKNYNVNENKYFSNIIYCNVNTNEITIDYKLFTSYTLFLLLKDVETMFKEMSSKQRTIYLNNIVTNDNPYITSLPDIFDLFDYTLMSMVKNEHIMLMHHHPDISNTYIYGLLTSKLAIPVSLSTELDNSLNELNQNMSNILLIKQKKEELQSVTHSYIDSITIVNNDYTEVNQILKNNFLFTLSILSKLKSTNVFNIPQLREILHRYWCCITKHVYTVITFLEAYNTI
jgi:hypothetical protein